MKTLPDTALVREARALLVDTLEPPILAHSLRVFLLGAAYAERRRVAFDEEGLLLAAMFHDLGLTPARRQPRRPFPLVGADALATMLAPSADPRAGALHDAIAMHMELSPRWSAGPAAGLLHVGAWMDAAGRYAREVDLGERAEIAAAYPRDGFDGLFRRRVLGSIGSLGACLGLTTSYGRR